MRGDGELDERDRSARAIVLDVVGERVPIGVRNNRARPVAVEVGADDVDPVVARVELAHIGLRPAQIVPVDLAARQLVVVDVGDAAERVLVLAVAGRVVAERVPRIVLERGLPAEPDDRRRVAELLPALGDGAVVLVEVAAGALGELALGAPAQERRRVRDADAALGQELGSPARQNCAFSHLSQPRCQFANVVWTSILRPRKLSSASISSAASRVRTEPVIPLIHGRPEWLAPELRLAATGRAAAGAAESDLRPAAWAGEPAAQLCSRRPPASVSSERRATGRSTISPQAGSKGRPYHRSASCGVNSAPRYRERTRRRQL